jgi:hypothetical protein
LSLQERRAKIEKMRKEREAHQAEIAAQKLAEMQEKDKNSAHKQFIDKILSSSQTQIDQLANPSGIAKANTTGGSAEQRVVV